MWETMSMSNLWDLLCIDDKTSICFKPVFPTRRWGNITLQYSTTEKAAIDKGIEKLKAANIKCRKRIDYENTNKLKRTSGNKKFYKIEIYNEKTTMAR